MTEHICNVLNFLDKIIFYIKENYKSIIVYILIEVLPAEIAYIIVEYLV